MYFESSHRVGPAAAGGNYRGLVGKMAAVILAAGALWSTAAQAATVFIPNGSFESPTNDFASPEMGSWVKAPQPLWYVDPSGGMFPWEALVGQFLNTSNGSPDHIQNLDGSQAAYLFASPEVAIFQDYSTVSGSGAGASHPFNAQFEAGRSYALTVGVIGGGGGMSNGATLEISLYYRDSANDPVTVGATTVTNSPGLFPTNTHFTDFQVRIPFVKATDAWAGKRIGIRIASTAGFDKMAGYWDLDNVRLTDSVLPNDSFESPATDFASPEMENWEKATEPFWYVDPTGMFPWEALMGQFLNTTNGSPNHIGNMEGSQAAYLFASPDVAIFQDYNSIGGTNATPGHEFNASFEPGKAYALTVGVIGGGGGMSNGATLEISLYYRDAASNKVTVAARTVTNSPALFPTNTYFTDFQANVPTVKSNDAWAGKHIGVRLASTVGFDKMAGYWDVDNVRLTESLFPNGSFESPETDFAAPPMDGWQKAPQPFWYVDPTGMFPWEALMGQFLNTTNGSPDHIDNVDGAQAVYLFASPGVAIFQDYDSIGGGNTTPTHDFNAKFEVGKSYVLTVGVIGGGGGMSNGATLEVSFYYRDAASNKVTVAATTITNTPGLFPTNTHLTDFAAQVPTVKGGESWAGKHIGIQIASTVGFDKMGGYWDLDNARLRAVEDPVMKSPNVTGGHFQFALQSAPGRYEVLGSPNVTVSSAQWTSLGTVTNFTGSISVTDTNTSFGRRFYQVRPSP
jgi:hypothetical protein